MHFFQTITLIMLAYILSMLLDHQMSSRSVKLAEETKLA